MPLRRWRLPLMVDAFHWPPRGLSAAGEREAVDLRWGLLPFWAKDEKISYSTINARAETGRTLPRRWYAQATRRTGRSFRADIMRVRMTDSWMRNLQISRSAAMSQALSRCRVLGFPGAVMPAERTARATSPA